ncbi:Transcriptional regulator, AraC family [Bosea sp. LC85]|uniref:GlxA family transcriptional regulator n=1 Tax=Bosea sp. LC85 TaxID=1502851 RepID=UPI0004E3C65D|nr:helix-turn-helix domain-containing protein [Bosea sp. LC85]KFC64959.1 Transcriptional regulator, AraC family [Bosea sp. LC85]
MFQSATRIEQAMQDIKVGILVFEKCGEAGLAIPLDVFRVCDGLAQRHKNGPRIRFEPVFVAAEGGTRETASGFTIRTVTAHPDELDALIVPGIAHPNKPGIEHILVDLVAEQHCIARFAAAGRLVLGTCSGVFLIGASGALDQRKATTSWWLGAEFARLFPDVRMSAESALIHDGNCVSAGGVAAYYDLALWLVQHFAGAKLRSQCAKILLVDMGRQSQTPYVARVLIDQPTDALFVQARTWLNQRLDQPISVADLARHCRASPRTLLRRFQEGLQQTPAQYVQSLRLERAKTLLEGSALSADEIAARCGYQDVAAFRKAFKQRIRLTPNQYRGQFRPPATSSA